jgi:tetratricopeptide (TPR) repeat protein
MERQPVNINLRSKDNNTNSFFDRPRRAVEPVAHTPPLEEKRDLEIKQDSKFIVKAFDKIIDVSLLMIFFGFPLFFTGLSSQGIIFEKQIYFYFWLLLGLVAWTAKGVTVGEMNIRRTPLDLPIIGFWLAYLLATIFSIDRWHSFWGAFADPSRGLMSVTAIIIGYYLIFSNFNNSRRRIMTGAVVAAGTIISIWTLLAILNIKFLPDSVAQYAPVSLSGSMLGLAIIISALIPLLAVTILKIGESMSNDTGKKKIGKRVLTIFLLLVLALNLFLILALYNFIPWLALFIGIVVFLVFILSQIVRPASSWTWLPMVIFVAVMAISLVGVVSIAKINFSEVRPLDSNTSMTIAKESLKNKALLGSGPATYGYDFSLFRPQEFNNNMFYNLRFLQGTGVVFESISTTGAVGTFFLIILMLSFLSVEIYLIAKEKEKNKLMSLGIFSTAMILLISAVTTKIEGTVLIMSILLGILALATTLKESNSEEKYLGLSLKASPKFALALAFVFMIVSAGVAFVFVFLGKIYIADVYAGRASRVTIENKEDAVNFMGKAIQYYGQEGKYYTQLGQYYMILANDEAMKGQDQRDVNKIQQYINSSVAASNIAKDMQKNDVGTIEAVAQVYENTGLYVPDSYNLSMDNYQKGLELEPHNPSFYVKIGQIKLALASSKTDQNEKKQLINEASDMFSKAIAEKSDLAEAQYQLSITQSALGQADAAIESGKKAVVANSQNTDYIVNLARLLQNRGTGSDMKDAEQLYKAIIDQNDSNVNGHFYLGLLYEKEKNKQGAKEQYNKVITLLPANNDDTKKQLQKMISNIDAGVENTPQSLGLTPPSDAATDNSSAAPVVPAQ